MHNVQILSCLGLDGGQSLAIPRHCQRGVTVCVTSDRDQGLISIGNQTNLSALEIVRTFLCIEGENATPIGKPFKFRRQFVFEAGESTDLAIGHSEETDTPQCVGWI